MISMIDFQIEKPMRKVDCHCCKFELFTFTYQRDHDGSDLVCDHCGYVDRVVNERLDPSCTPQQHS